MKQILLSFSILIAATMVNQEAFAQPAPGGTSPVITEIMYNPPEANNDTLEFLEILNPSTTASINLAGFYFSSGIEYTFPAGVMLAPGEYAIIAGDSVIFEEWYGMEAYEWTGGTALSNDGEGLTLRTAGGTIADTVFFDDTNAWADADATGYSLVLCDPTADNNVPENWTLSENATGLIVNSLEIFADPNAASSCTPTGIADNDVTATVVYPNPTEGAFTMQFAALEESGALKVHNSLGQMVYSEAISSGSTILNLTADLPSGFYVITLESGKSIERHNLIVQ